MESENTVCKCGIPLSYYYPPPLVVIIQTYLHSTTLREEFYMVEYAHLSFKVWLDKDGNSIEEQYIKLITTSTPNYQNNNFIIEVGRVNSIYDDGSRWLQIFFTLDGRDIFFRTCISEDPTHLKENKKRARPENSYRAFASNLQGLFDKDNKDILLNKLALQCRITPSRNDFELIFAYVSAKIATWVAAIDLYGEIHR